METSWPQRPIIYEINTWVWLNSLSRHYKRAITLSNVPAEQWDAIAPPSVDAVWLMGVWERSPEGIRFHGARSPVGHHQQREVVWDVTAGTIRNHLRFSTCLSVQGRNWPFV